MAFALMSKPKRAALVSAQPVRKRKPAPGQRTIDSQLGFERPMFWPQSMVSASVIQAKLKIGEPNDKFEQEADRVADEVMRMPDSAVKRIAPLSMKHHRITALNSPGAAQFKLPSPDASIKRQHRPAAVSEQAGGFHIHRFCAECEEEMPWQATKEEEKVACQAKEIPSRISEVAPSLGSRLPAMRGSGQPLPEFVRVFFEPRLGRDLGDVRIHADAQAAAAVREVDALAFTIGRDVVFGAGEYRPNTDAGRRLLAHELVHVTQQDAGRAPAVLQLKPRTHWRDGKPLFYDSEAEALRKIEFVKSLGKSDLLGLDGLKVDDNPPGHKVNDPPGLVHEKEGWTFYYFPLTRAEAEAAKTAAEDKPGKKDVFTVEFSDLARSFFIRPKCPDAVPLEAGWTTWNACFPTEDKAKAQVKKFKDAHIEAKTGRLQEDQFYVLFQPLTEAEAKTKGKAEAEAKTRVGSAKGMLFTAEPSREPGLKSFTYRLEPKCPSGFKPLGKFRLTSYFIPDESQFPEKPTEKDPCGLKGTFRAQFLHKVEGSPPLGVDMEGNGRTLTGKIINWVKKEKKRGKETMCYEEVPKALGKNDRPLTVDGSVAVDRTKILIGAELLIEDVGLRTADDIGDKVKGNHIDVYKGPYDKTKDTTLLDKLVCQKKPA